MSDEAAGKDDEIFTRIALDNKLVSKWQLKRATEEQTRCEAEEGKRPALAEVLVSLGFLTERQHRSVRNAQKYRDQRDDDKRFARQVLRMSLVGQERLEQGLESQKNAYVKNGVVKGLADLLLEKKQLTPSQVEEVRRALMVRAKRKRTHGSSATEADRAASAERDSSRQPQAQKSGQPKMTPLSGVVDLVGGAEEPVGSGESGASGASGDEDEAEAGGVDPDDLGDADELDLARDLGDLPDGSDIDLDDDDLEALADIESRDDEAPAEVGWATAAFDDRPLAKQPVVSPSVPAVATRGDSRRVAAPGADDRAPVAPPQPPNPPVIAARPSRSDPAPRIPGGEVLDDSALVSSGAATEVLAVVPLAPFAEVDTTAKLTESASALEDLLDRVDGELRALPDHASPTLEPLDETRLRRAFDRAVAIAWKVFLEELRGSQ